jgi:hypothetical protein
LIDNEVNTLTEGHVGYEHSTWLTKLGYPLGVNRHRTKLN